MYVQLERSQQQEYHSPQQYSPQPRYYPPSMSVNPLDKDTKDNILSNILASTVDQYNATLLTLQQNHAKIAMMQREKTISKAIAQQSLDDTADELQTTNQNSTQRALLQSKMQIAQAKKDISYLTALRGNEEFADSTPATASGIVQELTEKQIEKLLPRGYHLSKMNTYELEALAKQLSAQTAILSEEYKQAFIKNRDMYPTTILPKLIGGIGATPKPLPQTQANLSLLGPVYPPSQ